MSYVGNKISEAVEGYFDDMGNNFKEILNSVLQSIQDGANFFLKEMTDFVLYTPDISSDPVVLKLWSIVKVISFALIGVMFVWEGFKRGVTLNNLSRVVEFKEMFVRLIYGIILTVFSLDIVKILLNFNDALIDTVRQSFPIVVEQQIGVSGFFSTLMVIALLVVQIVIGVKLILQYWIRIAELWLMTVISPIMYVLWINPMWSGYLGQWFRRLTTTIFTTFIWCILLSLYSSMVSMVASAGMLSGYPILGPIASMCLSIALLLVMVETPSFLRTFMDSHESALTMLKNTGSKVMGGVKKPFNVAGKVTGWIRNRGGGSAT